MSLHCPRKATSPSRWSWSRRATTCDGGVTFLPSVRPEPALCLCGNGTTLDACAAHRHRRPYKAYGQFKEVPGVCQDAGDRLDAEQHIRLHRLVHLRGLGTLIFLHASLQLRPLPHCSAPLTRRCSRTVKRVADVRPQVAPQTPPCVITTSATSSSRASYGAALAGCNVGADFCAWSRRRYAVEFDRVHYPLPLAYCETPSPGALLRTIRRLKKEKRDLLDRLGDDVGSTRSAVPPSALAALKRENADLRRRLAASGEADGALRPRGGRSTHSTTSRHVLALTAGGKFDEMANALRAESQAKRVAEAALERLKAASRAEITRLRAALEDLKAKLEVCCDRWKRGGLSLSPAHTVPVVRRMSPTR